MHYRNKWSGVVGIVWLLVALVVLGAVVVISNHGSYEMNVPGSYRTETIYNGLVIAGALGQAVAALLIGLLFTMINSVYQAVCDSRQVDKEVSSSGPEPEEEIEAAPPNEDFDEKHAIKVDGLYKGSPLIGKLQYGAIILAVNHQPVSSKGQAEAAMNDGKNSIEFMDFTGRKQRKVVDIPSANPEWEVSQVPRP